MKSSLSFSIFDIQRGFIFTMVTIKLAHFIQMPMMTIFNVQRKSKGSKDSNIAGFGLTVRYNLYGISYTVNGMTLSKMTSKRYPILSLEKDAICLQSAKNETNTVISPYKCLKLQFNKYL